MASNVTAHAEERQDLAGLVSRYRRHVPLVILAVVVTMALLGLLTAFMPKRYTASAELTFAPQAAPVKGPNQGSDQVLSDAARDAAIDQNVQSIESLPVAVAVVKDLGLDRDLTLRDAAKQYASGNTREAVAAAVLQGLRVRRVGQTALIDVSYTSNDPLRAAKVANSFGQSYVDQQLAQKVAESKESSGRIDERVAVLAAQARDADAAVARFKLQHNVLDETGSTALQAEAGSISASLADARAAQAESVARSGLARRSGADGGTFRDALTSPTVVELRRQQAEVSRRVAALSSRYGEKHPLRIDAEREQTDINNRIDQELKRQASNATGQDQVASQRVASLEASLARTHAREANDVASGVQLAVLKREADTAHELYNNVLTTSGHETANRALVQPDVKVTSPANPPLKPSSPNLFLNLIVGLALGLAIGLAAAFIRERWSVGLNSNDDIEHLLGQDFLNSVPTLASSIESPRTRDPLEAITVHPLSLYTEAFRSLATSLRMSKPDVKVIAVTSALPREGKTTTSAAIARVLAMAGDRVVIVDTDLRRRSVTNALLSGVEKGLVEVVRGEATLDEVIQRDASGADIVPLAPQSHLGSQPFETPAFAALMATLRERYDTVVLDTAPILAVVDTRLLLKHIDALALLARWRGTPVRAIRAAVHQIEAVGGSIAGVAMTLVNVKSQAHSGYGDASYYYADMKDYYAA